MKSKMTSGTSTMAGAVGLGAAVSLTVTLIAAAIFAALISAETVPVGNMDYYGLVILLLAAIAGSAAASGRMQQKRLYLCLLTGAAYYLVLLAMTALFFGGQYQGMGATALVVLAGCAVVILLGLKGGKRGASRKSKIRHR